LMLCHNITYNSCFNYTHTNKAPNTDFLGYNTPECYIVECSNNKKDMYHIQYHSHLQFATHYLPIDKSNSSSLKNTFSH